MNPLKFSFHSAQWEHFDTFPKLVILSYLIPIALCSTFDLASDAVSVPSAVMYEASSADLSIPEPKQTGTHTTLHHLLDVVRPGQNKSITVKIIAVSKI